MIREDYSYHAKNIFVIIRNKYLISVKTSNILYN